MEKKILGFRNIFDHDFTGIAFFLVTHLLSIFYLDFYIPSLFGLLFPFSIWIFFQFNFCLISVRFQFSILFFLLSLSHFGFLPNNIWPQQAVFPYLSSSLLMNDPFLLVLTAVPKRLMGHFCIVMDLGIRMLLKMDYERILLKLFLQWYISSLSMLCSLIYLLLY